VPYRDTPSGAVAWLDVSMSAADGGVPRSPTGPLGLHVAPLADSRVRYFFQGARLRGARCVISAATVSSAELTRPARDQPDAATAVHLLVRIRNPGSVFDPAASFSGATLRVLEPDRAVTERFPVNSHLVTLNVAHAALGNEAAAINRLYGQTFTLSPFQGQILRANVSLLTGSTDGLSSGSGLLGLDRYLGALAALLLRTTSRPARSDEELMDSIRNRSDAIIYEQATDPTMTPASVAAQLNVSLRQLYRAYDRSEPPAARIRRRRLEHAAELLATRPLNAHVESVAAESGFASAEYFSRAFRREFGVSPRAYRFGRRQPTASVTAGS
jgi:AraC-like DNA-binding protein